MEKRSGSHDWIVVYVTFNLHEAQVVLGRLESEGIKGFLHQAAGASAMGIHIGSLGEIKVLVHPADYDLAQDILFSDEPAELTDDNDRIIFDADFEDDADE